MGLLTKFKCLVVGWNYSILQECGEASHRQLNKYIAAITIISTIWAVIGYCFADRYIGFENPFGKIAVASVFVVLIVCIERYLILNVGKLGAAGIFRVFLAVLMAVLGSTIFDQIMFRNDVEVKMKEIRTEQINAEIPKRIAFLDKDIVETMTVIDSLGKENIRLYETLSKRPTIAVTDVNTTSKQVGTDSLGNAIMQKSSTVSKRHVENPLNAQVKANEAALQMYQDRLEQFQKAKMNVAAQVRVEYENARVGFLEELQALFSIVLGNWVALAFYVFLFLFLMCLELLVVTSKGGESSKCDYDLIVEHQLSVKHKSLKQMVAQSIQ